MPGLDPESLLDVMMPDGTVVDQARLAAPAALVAPAALAAPPLATRSCTRRLHSSRLPLAPLQDYRDVKIVQLAKKVRGLNSRVNAEKAKAAKLAKARRRQLLANGPDALARRPRGA